jgi:RNA polymerase sigma factor (sigma-70 family)
MNDRAMILPTSAVRVSSGRQAGPLSSDGAECTSMTGGAVDSGDKAARFKALALPHLNAAYTLARYLMRNASDADDAVQDCYLRAFRHFDSYRGPVFKPWLMTILRNVCRAAYAAPAHARMVAIDGTDGVDGSAIEASWHQDNETPEQSMLRRDASDTMRGLIRKLPPEYAEVIVMREFNDLSYREIATVIDAPIGTVMSRLARARALLRDAWLAAEGKVERR